MLFMDSELGALPVFSKYLAAFFAIFFAERMALRPAEVVATGLS
jgi:hypothetical protein